MQPHRPSSGARPPPERSAREAAPDRAGSFGLELELRRALREREPRALEAFFDAFFDAVHGYVQRMVRDAHAAEDLTQEIFLKVYRALPRYAPERALRPWVFTIASNTIRDHFQSAAVRSRTSELEEDALPDRPRSAGGGPKDGSIDGPGAELEREETAAAVSRAIAALSPALRSVLVLRHHQGLPFAEIAAALELTEAAARQRFARALAELRRRLAAQGPLGEERA